MWWPVREKCLARKWRMRNNLIVPSLTIVLPPGEFLGLMGWNIYEGLLPWWPRDGPKAMVQQVIIPLSAACAIHFFFLMASNAWQSTFMDDQNLWESSKLDFTRGSDSIHRPFGSFNQRCCLDGTTSTHLCSSTGYGFRLLSHNRTGLVKATQKLLYIRVKTCLDFCVCTNQLEGYTEIHRT